LVIFVGMGLGVGSFMRITLFPEANASVIRPLSKRLILSLFFILNYLITLPTGKITQREWRSNYRIGIGKYVV
jgi:hypothetical protein